MCVNMLLLCALLACPAAESGTPAKSEKEVLSVMDVWKQAMIARDRSILEKLYAPGLIYFHSNGREENKTEAIEAVVSGKDSIEAIEFANTSVRIYGRTALVKNQVTMRTNSNGTPSILRLDVLHVWVKSGSRWQMVARHATRLNP